MFLTNKGLNKDFKIYHKNRRVIYIKIRVLSIVKKSSTKHKNAEFSVEGKISDACTEIFVI